jgi:glycosyltransferase involved in cell wall biosynthesis
VLEAFAAGVPVIGSDLGGIAAFVRNGIDGCLVDGRRVTDWCSALARIVASPRLLGQLRANLNTPRSMSEVSGETLQLYQSLVRFKQRICYASA